LKGSGKVKDPAILFLGYFLLPGEQLQRRRSAVTGWQSIVQPISVASTASVILVRSIGEYSAYPSGTQFAAFVANESIENIYISSIA
jgi:hypothetical protein